MLDPTPKVNLSRGAPMGRRGLKPEPKLAGAVGRTYLRRCPLDSGGYDRGGAYWGLGQPLWFWQTPDDESGYLRARNREAAKAEVLTARPDAVFFR